MSALSDILAPVQPPPDSRYTPPPQRQANDPQHPSSHPQSHTRAYPATSTSTHQFQSEAPQLETVPAGDHVAGQSRQRIAKACETCRLRRIKCSGETPCRNCKENNQADKCVVRMKARPNRPITSRNGRKSSISSQQPSHSPSHELPREDLPRQSLHLEPSPRSAGPSRSHPARPPPLVGFPAISPLLALSDASMLPSARARRDSASRMTPINQIEARLGAWCSVHDLQISSMIFKDETRLSALHASPLPPDSDIEAFEDELMRQLIITNDLEQASSLDRLQIVTLYNRYRVFPTALTADQKALVYAALSLAKHALMKSYVSTGSPVAASETREDVTYFRMACECLAQWSFPSVHALWALVCLVPYSQAHGGLAENRELLRMMAWQVRELGLHRRDMGKLYLSGEMSLFPVFRYMDTFLAGLDDLRPHFTLAESDVDIFGSTSILVPCQQTVSDHAARFHDDYNDPNIDVASDEYVFLAESRWIPSLAHLQSGMVDTTRVKQGWAEIRYYWLRILLYYQRTSFDSVRATHAWIIVSHCLAQIIYIHHELALIGHLNPSWPQLRRFSICGQLLVLCCSQQVFQPLQATELFEKLLFLLEAHRETWTGAGDLLHGFQKAAGVLGLTISSMSPSVVLNMSLPPPRNALDTFNLEDFAFPFDPTVFFAPDTADTAGGAVLSGTGP